MTAAVHSGPASALPSLPGKGRPVEPFLLESVLEHIRVLRRRFRRLAREASAEAARQSSPAWHRLRDEVDAAQRRAERLLLAAAARDRIGLLDDPGPAQPPAEAAEQSIERFRRWARELEEQCACLVSQSNALDLPHLAEALAQWRRDLIGLERPLIATKAASSGRRR